MKVIVAVDGHVRFTAPVAIHDLGMAPSRTPCSQGGMPQFVITPNHVDDVDCSVRINDNAGRITCARDVIDGVRRPYVCLAIARDVLVRHVEEACSGDGDFFTAGRPSIDWTQAVRGGAFTNRVSILGKREVCIQLMLIAKQE